MIAPHRVRGILRAQRLLAALRRHQRILRTPRSRKPVRLLVHKLRERPRHVVHKGRQAHRTACHVEHCLRRQPPAHHVHVHRRLDSPRKLRFSVQQRQRPLNLRRPEKSNRPRRPCQLPLRNQFLQRPSHLQNRHAPARIVVRPWPLMIQVAAKHNLLLLQFRIRAWNRRRHHFICARVLSRLHHRMQPNRFPAPQPLPQSPRRLQRHHEPKRLVWRESLQMPPPNQILILAPPRRLLVLRIADNPHHPKFPNRQILHRPRLRPHQNNLSSNILPRVVAILRAFAYVHQLRNHVRRLTVLRQHNRHRSIARNLFLATRHTPLATSIRICALQTFIGRSTRHLPQLSRLRIPPGPRPLRPVKNLSIRGKLQNRHIAQAIRPRPLRHQFRRRLKSRGPALPVQPRQPLEIPLRRLPAQLVRQRRHLLLPQQRRPLLRQSGSGRDNCPHQNNRTNLHRPLPFGVRRTCRRFSNAAPQPTPRNTTTRTTRLTRGTAISRWATGRNSANSTFIPLCALCGEIPGFVSPPLLSSPRMALSQRLHEIRDGFERPFWVANISEIFERLSYYGAFSSLAVYLQGKLSFSTEQTGTLTGIFGGMVWFLALFGGALADKLGFRRALSLAYLILAAAYFLIGSIGAGWLAPLRDALPLGLFVACILILPALGISLVKPSVVGTTARASRENVRSIGYSIYYTMVNIGAAAGPFVAD